MLGIEVDGARKTYPFRALDKARGERTPRLEDRLGGRKISMRFDRENRTAQAFDQRGREIPTVVGYWVVWYAFFSQTKSSRPADDALLSSRTALGSASQIVVVGHRMRAATALLDCGKSASLDREIAPQEPTMLRAQAPS